MRDEDNVEGDPDPGAEQSDDATDLMALIRVSRASAASNGGTICGTAAPVRNSGQ